MYLLFFVVYFFMFLLNILFPAIIRKHELGKAILQKAQLNEIGKFQCFNDNWFMIYYNIKGLQLSYFKRDNVPVTCEKELYETDAAINCDDSYYNKSNNCYKALSELISLN